MPVVGSDRQRRERAYYDEYARRTAPQEVSLAPLDREDRPFNPYWRAIAIIRAAFRADGQRLLDFGCGPGLYAVMCAHLGYEVFGFDLSGENVRAARALAAKYDLADRTHFSEGVAEELAYADEFFDVVMGVDILHHVDIASAIRECRRVLKPGGLAVFKEPVEAPLFDSLRNSRLGLWIAPKEPSFDRHITEDERKLTPSDLAVLRSVFPDQTVAHFRLFSRFERFLGRLALSANGASRLEVFDRWLLDAAPILRPLAGVVVVQLRKSPEMRGGAVQS